MVYINNYNITVDGPNEGPSAPSVITSPSYRIEDSSAEGPLGPTVTHPLATASKMLLLSARQDRH